MLDFKYYIARNNGKEHNPNFLNIKVMNKGSKVFLIIEENGIGSGSALRTIEYAIREPMIYVPAQFRLTNLDGTVAYRSYMGCKAK